MTMPKDILINWLTAILKELKDNKTVNAALELQELVDALGEEKK